MTREKWCHIGAAIIGCCILAPLLIALMDNRSCLTIRGGAFNPNEVYPGDVVMMTFSAQEHISCGGYVIRQFIDSSKVVHETLRESTIYHEVIDTEARAFSIYVTIPLLPPGPAVYAPIVYRWRNPVQALWPTRDLGVPRIAFLVKGGQSEGRNDLKQEPIQ